jgi:hypothetical protein
MRGRPSCRQPCLGLLLLFDRARLRRKVDSEDVVQSALKMTGVEGTGPMTRVPGEPWIDESDSRVLK